MLIVVWTNAVVFPVLADFVTWIPWIILEFLSILDCWQGMVTDLELEIATHSIGLIVKAQFATEELVALVEDSIQMLRTPPHWFCAADSLHVLHQKFHVRRLFFQHDVECLVPYRVEIVGHHFCFV